MSKMAKDTKKQEPEKQKEDYEHSEAEWFD